MATKTAKKTTTKKTIAKKKSARVKKKLIDYLVTFLKSSDLKFQTDDDPNILTMQFGGDKTAYKCVFDVQDEKGIILFYIFGPVQVPTEKILDACKFIALANFGLQVGNLELDVRDGEVRYKSVLILEGATPQKSTFKRFIYPAIISMDKYYPKLLKFIYSDISPEQAVTEADEK